MINKMHDTWKKHGVTFGKHVIEEEKKLRLKKIDEQIKQLDDKRHKIIIEPTIYPKYMGKKDIQQLHMNETEMKLCLKSFKEKHPSKSYAHKMIESFSKLTEEFLG
tara:strand:+ start:105 stop:422 length:318 start_codon:yes stop_codon:yes gene_type:complete